MNLRGGEADGFNQFDHPVELSVGFTVDQIGGEGGPVAWAVPLLPKAIDDEGCDRVQKDQAFVECLGVGGFVDKGLAVGRHARRCAHRDVVAFGDLIVAEVVGARDLDRAGAECRVGVFVGIKDRAVSRQQGPRMLGRRCRRARAGLYGAGCGQIGVATGAGHCVCTR